MPFFSGIADKVIDVTSSLIVVVALHVPLLMGYLIAPQPVAQLPVNKPVAVVHTETIAPEAVKQQESLSSLSSQAVDVHEYASPDGAYIAKTSSTEGGDITTYLTDKWGDVITPTICGAFVSWMPSSKQVSLYAPLECGYTLGEGNFLYDVMGIGKTAEGEIFFPRPDIESFAGNVLSEFANGSPQTATSSFGVISFGPPPNDVIHQNVNAGFEVYINGVYVGEIGGELKKNIGFSPDGAYYAVKMSLNSGCAGKCQDFKLSMIDMRNKKLISVPWPSKPPTPMQKLPFDEGETPYSENYLWHGDTLAFTFYYLDSYLGHYYRNSPKQVWSYDVQSAAYALVQTLAE